MIDLEAMRGCLRRAFAPSADPDDPMPRTPTLKDAIKKNEALAIQVVEMIVPSGQPMERTMRNISDRMKR